MKLLVTVAVFTAILQLTCTRPYNSQLEGITTGFSDNGDLSIDSGAINSVTRDRMNEGKIHSVSGRNTAGVNIPRSDTDNGSGDITSDSNLNERIDAVATENSGSEATRFSDFTSYSNVNGVSNEVGVKSFSNVAESSGDVVELGGSSGVPYNGDVKIPSIDSEHSDGISSGMDHDDVGSGGGDETYSNESDSAGDGVSSSNLHGDGSGVDFTSSDTNYHSEDRSDYDLSDVVGSRKVSSKIDRGNPVGMIPNNEILRAPKKVSSISGVITRNLVPDVIHNGNDVKQGTDYTDTPISGLTDVPNGSGLETTNRNRTNIGTAINGFNNDGGRKHEGTRISTGSNKTKDEVISNLNLDDVLDDSEESASIKRSNSMGEGLDGGGLSDRISDGAGVQKFTSSIEKSPQFDSGRSSGSIQFEKDVTTSRTIPDKLGDAVSRIPRISSLGGLKSSASTVENFTKAMRNRGSSDVPMDDVVGTPRTIPKKIRDVMSAFLEIHKLGRLKVPTSTFKNPAPVVGDSVTGDGHLTHHTIQKHIRDVVRGIREIALNGGLRNPFSTIKNPKRVIRSSGSNDVSINDDGVAPGTIAKDVSDDANGIPKIPGIKQAATVNGDSGSSDTPLNDGVGTPSTNSKGNADDANGNPKIPKSGGPETSSSAINKATTVIGDSSSSNAPINDNVETPDAISKEIGDDASGSLTVSEIRSLENSSSAIKDAATVKGESGSSNAPINDKVGTPSTNSKDNGDGASGNAKIPGIGGLKTSSSAINNVATVISDSGSSYAPINDDVETPDAISKEIGDDDSGSLEVSRISNLKLSSSAITDAATVNGDSGSSNAPMNDEVGTPSTNSKDNGDDANVNPEIPGIGGPKTSSRTINDVATVIGDSGSSNTPINDDVETTDAISKEIGDDTNGSLKVSKISSLKISSSAIKDAATVNGDIDSSNDPVNDRVETRSTNSKDNDDVASGYPKIPGIDGPKTSSSTINDVATVIGDSGSSNAPIDDDVETPDAISKKIGVDASGSLKVSEISSLKLPSSAMKDAATVNGDSGSSNAPMNDEVGTASTNSKDNGDDANVKPKIPGVGGPKTSSSTINDVATVIGDGGSSNAPINDDVETPDAISKKIGDDTNGSLKVSKIGSPKISSSAIKDAATVNGDSDSSDDPINDKVETPSTNANDNGDVASGNPKIPGIGGPKTSTSAINDVATAISDSSSSDAPINDDVETPDVISKKIGDDTNGSLEVSKIRSLRISSSAIKDAATVNGDSYSSNNPINDKVETPSTNSKDNGDVASGNPKIPGIGGPKTSSSTIDDVATVIGDSGSTNAPIDDDVETSDAILKKIGVDASGSLQVSKISSLKISSSAIKDAATVNGDSDSSNAPMNDKVGTSSTNSKDNGDDTSDNPEIPGIGGPKTSSSAINDVATAIGDSGSSNAPINDGVETPDAISGNIGVDASGSLEVSRMSSLKPPSSAIKDAAIVNGDSGSRSAPMDDKVGTPSTNSIDNGDDASGNPKIPGIGGPKTSSRKINDVATVIGERGSSNAPITDVVETPDAISKKIRDDAKGGLKVSEISSLKISSSAIVEAASVNDDAGSSSAPINDKVGTLSTISKDNGDDTSGNPTIPVIGGPKTTSSAINDVATVIGDSSSSNAPINDDVETPVAISKKTGDDASGSLKVSRISSLKLPSSAFKNAATVNGDSGSSNAPMNDKVGTPSTNSEDNGDDASGNPKIPGIGGQKTSSSAINDVATVIGDSGSSNAPINDSVETPDAISKNIGDDASGSLEVSQISSPKLSSSAIKDAATVNGDSGSSSAPINDKVGTPSTKSKDNGDDASGNPKIPGIGGPKTSSSAINDVATVIGDSGSSNIPINDDVETPDTNSKEIGDDASGSLKVSKISSLKISSSAIGEAAPVNDDAGSSNAPMNDKVGTPSTISKDNSDDTSGNPTIPVIGGPKTTSSAINDAATVIGDSSSSNAPINDDVETPDAISKKIGDDARGSPKVSVISSLKISSSAIEKAASANDDTGSSDAPINDKVGTPSTNSEANGDDTSGNTKIPSIGGPKTSSSANNDVASVIGDSGSSNAPINDDAETPDAISKNIGDDASGGLKVSKISSLKLPSSAFKDAATVNGDSGSSNAPMNDKVGTPSTNLKDNGDDASGNLKIPGIGGPKTSSTAINDVATVIGDSGSSNAPINDGVETPGAISKNISDDASGSLKVSEISSLKISSNAIKDAAIVNGDSDSSNAPINDKVGTPRIISKDDGDDATGILKVSEISSLEPSSSAIKDAATVNGDSDSSNAPMNDKVGTPSTNSKDNGNDASGNPKIPGSGGPETSSSAINEVVTVIGDSGSSNAPINDGVETPDVISKKNVDDANGSLQVSEISSPKISSSTIGEAAPANDDAGSSNAPMNDKVGTPSIISKDDGDDTSGNPEIPGIGGPKTTSSAINDVATVIGDSGSSNAPINDVVETPDAISKKIGDDATGSLKVSGISSQEPSSSAIKDAATVNGDSDSSNAHMNDKVGTPSTNSKDNGDDASGNPKIPEIGGPKTSSSAINDVATVIGDSGSSNIPINDNVETPDAISKKIGDDARGSPNVSVISSLKISSSAIEKAASANDDTGFSNAPINDKVGTPSTISEANGDDTSGNPKIPSIGGPKTSSSANNDVASVIGDSGSSNAPINDDAETPDAISKNIGDDASGGLKVSKISSLKLPSSAFKDAATVNGDSGSSNAPMNDKVWTPSTILKDNGDDASGNPKIPGIGGPKTSSSAINDVATVIGDSGFSNAPINDGVETPGAISKNIGDDASGSLEVSEISSLKISSSAIKDAAIVNGDSDSSNAPINDKLGTPSTNLKESGDDASGNPKIPESAGPETSSSAINEVVSVNSDSVSSKAPINDVVETPDAISRKIGDDAKGSLKVSEISSLKIPSSTIGEAAPANDDAGSSNAPMNDKVGTPSIISKDDGDDTSGYPEIPGNGGPKTTSSAINDVATVIGDSGSSNAPINDVVETPDAISKKIGDDATGNLKVSKISSLKLTSSAFKDAATVNGDSGSSNAPINDKVGTPSTNSKDNGDDASGNPKIPGIGGPKTSSSAINDVATVIGDSGSSNTPINDDVETPGAISKEIGDDASGSLKVSKISSLKISSSAIGEAAPVNDDAGSSNAPMIDKVGTHSTISKDNSDDTSGNPTIPVIGGLKTTSSAINDVATVIGDSSSSNAPINDDVETSDAISKKIGDDARGSLKVSVISSLKISSSAIEEAASANDDTGSSNAPINDKVGTPSTISKDNGDDTSGSPKIPSIGGPKTSSSANNDVASVIGDSGFSNAPINNDTETPDAISKNIGDDASGGLKVSKISSLKLPSSAFKDAATVNGDSGSSNAPMNDKVGTPSTNLKDNGDDAGGNPKIPGIGGPKTSSSAINDVATVIGDSGSSNAPVIDGVETPGAISKNIGDDASGSLKVSKISSLKISSSVIKDAAIVNSDSDSSNAPINDKLGTPSTNSKESGDDASGNPKIPGSAGPETSSSAINEVVSVNGDSDSSNAPINDVVETPDAISKKIGDDASDSLKVSKISSLKLPSSAFKDVATVNGDSGSSNAPMNDKVGTPSTNLKDNGDDASGNPKIPGIGGPKTSSSAINDVATVIGDSGSSNAPINDGVETPDAISKNIGDDASGSLKVSKISSLKISSSAIKDAAIVNGDSDSSNAHINDKLGTPSTNLKESGDDASGNPEIPGSAGPETSSSAINGVVSVNGNSDSSNAPINDVVETPDAISKKIGDDAKGSLKVSEVSSLKITSSAIGEAASAKDDAGSSNAPINDKVGTPRIISKDDGDDATGILKVSEISSLEPSSSAIKDAATVNGDSDSGNAPMNDKVGTPSTNSKDNGDDASGNPKIPGIGGPKTSSSAINDVATVIGDSGSSNAPINDGVETPDAISKNIGDDASGSLKVSKISSLKISSSAIKDAAIVNGDSDSSNAPINDKLGTPSTNLEESGDDASGNPEIPGSAGPETSSSAINEVVSVNGNSDSSNAPINDVVETPDAISKKIGDDAKGSLKVSEVSSLKIPSSAIGEAASAKDDAGSSNAPINDKVGTPRIISKDDGDDATGILKVSEISSLEPSSSAIKDAATVNGDSDSGNAPMNDKVGTPSTNSKDNGNDASGNPKIPGSGGPETSSSAINEVVTVIGDSGSSNAPINDGVETPDAISKKNLDDANGSLQVSEISSPKISSSAIKEAATVNGDSGSSGAHINDGKVPPDTITKEVPKPSGIGGLKTSTISTRDSVRHTIRKKISSSNALVRGDETISGTISDGLSAGSPSVSNGGINKTSTSSTKNLPVSTNESSSSDAQIKQAVKSSGTISNNSAAVVTTSTNTSKFSTETVSHSSSIDDVIDKEMITRSAISV